MMMQILFSVGEFLTWPWDTAATDVMAIALPLKPGFHGQARNRGVEIMNRVLRVFRVIVSVPFLITGGILGAPIRCIANHRLRREGIMIMPPSPTPFIEIQRLSIMTFNTALMPAFISKRNTLQSWRKRVADLAHQICTRGDDIVVLQEVFDAVAERTLIRALRPTYPYMVRKAGYRWCTLNSGLMIASKFPLRNPVFVRHPVTGGADRMANKGVLIAEVVLDEKRSIIVSNTHLNGGSAYPPGNILRAKQLQHMHECVSNYKAAGGTVVGVFACGDYNIGQCEGNGASNAEWEQNQELLNGAVYTNGVAPAEQDQGSIFEINDPQVGWSPDVDRWQVTKERADHILLATTYPTVRPESIQVDRMNGTSDHLAVRGRYLFGGASPDPSPLWSTS